MVVLSPEQRKTLLLKEVEGLKYEEIAEQEGCSVGTIKSRVFRARQILMPLLQEWL
jgi:RNA polymerase sigma-70 factor, ECF subfamily